MKAENQKDHAVEVLWAVGATLIEAPTHLHLQRYGMQIVQNTLNERNIEPPSKKAGTQKEKCNDVPESTRNRGVTEAIKAVCSPVPSSPCNRLPETANLSAGRGCCSVG